MNYAYKTRGTCSRQITFSVEDGKVKNPRTPIFPEEWKNQFGIPFSEHKKALQINMLDGYTVFSLTDKKEKADTEEEEP